jgi:hypothetical protein
MLLCRVKEREREKERQQVHDEFALSPFLSLPLFLQAEKFISNLSQTL